MKASDLREKSVEDLRELQVSLAHDTFQNRLKNFTNRLDDTSAIRKTKRDLARVYTILHARAAAAPAEAAPAKAEPVKAAAVEAAPVEAAATPKKKPSKKTKAEAKQS
jgi:large subunit ribosomal protein L29